MTDRGPDNERVPDVDLLMPAHRESVMIARQALGGLADALDWPAEVTGDVKIALSEACSNVVLHAYPDGRAGPLRVRLWADPDRLTVSVCDEGTGISPSMGKNAGLGLGIPLMAALSDEVQMRSAQDGVTEVRMSFGLTGHPEIAG